MQVSRLTAITNRFKRQVLTRVKLLRIAIAVIAVGLFCLVLPPAIRVVNYARSFTGGNLPQTSGRTNILVLGIGGGDHEGPDLTDSMTFISLKRSTGEATLISIPRDIWINSLRSKINAAFHYGEEKQPGGGGLVLAKSAVSELLNQPVHLAVVIDFSTFKSAINLLGGVDVQVKETFEDDQYPISGKENDLCDGDPAYGCRYETIKFFHGLQHMNGETALKFVRSRHAIGDQGTDFARGKRQEAILTAIKTKLLSYQTLKQPEIYTKLFDIFTTHTLTDISRNQYFELGKLFFEAKNHLLKTYALSDPEQLYNPPVSSKFDNQWVLVPKDNNPQIVIDFVAAILK